MRTCCLGLLALALALASCGKHDDKPAANAGGSGSAAAGSGSGSGAGSAAVAPGAVALYVDDAKVATVSPAPIATWPRLDTLVPTAARRFGKWQDVTLIGAGDKPNVLKHPTATYPELVPALFPGKDGSPAFGMFDPVELAKHGKPQLESDDIHEMHVALAHNSGRGQHEQGAGGGTDPMQLKIEVTTSKGKQVIDGAKLLAIPRSPLPGETGPGRGWPLTAVLEAAGVEKYQRLLLTDAAGMNLTLDKRDFDPKSSVPFIKLNRQGQLRVRVYKKRGDAWQTQGDLRGLVAIEVVK
jgi:hypothetical protein